MAYIDREKVLKAVEKMDRLDKETKTKYEYDKEGFLLLINSAPTADVQEVKHGYWIENLYCSVCGNTYDTGEYHNDNNYCCRCGAKMDLKEVN